MGLVNSFPCAGGAPQAGVEGGARYAAAVRSQVPRCRRNRKGIVSRLLSVLRFRRDLRRCGDFLLGDPPTDTFVREPRRPRPKQPGGAIALELPNRELLN